MLVSISTRTGNAVVYKGDGSAGINNSVPLLTDLTVSNNLLSYTYTTAFTGNISVKFLHGLKDVYSIKLGHDLKAAQTEKYNIADIAVLLAQFPNLFSFMMDEIPAPGIPNNASNIGGDLSNLPNSVERVFLRNTVVSTVYNLYLNFSNYQNASKLKYFESNALRLTGDFKVPPLCSFFKILGTREGSSITYTAGKSWPSVFDTLYLPAALGVLETDSLFADMDNSIITAEGSKSITILNGYRSSASDSHVASLQAKGFTVTCARLPYVALKILDMPLQNSFTDLTGLNTMVAGGTSNQPTFVSDGAGGYAANFNGSQSLKTSANLPISNSDKVTIYFEIKTTQIAVATPLELGSNTATDNMFSTNINTVPGAILAGSYKAGVFNQITSPNINDGAFKKVTIIIDRALGGSQSKIYINGVESWTMRTPNNVTGNFGSHIFFVGQRGASTNGFVGQIKNLKIFNFPLTQTEINNL